jgi:hypothetical protein
MSTEQWQTIFYYPKYEVSDLGRICNSGKIIQIKNGMAILTDEEGNKKYTSVERLVLHTFFEECKNLTLQEMSHLVINYSDSNENNISANNMRIVGIKLNEYVRDLQEYKLFRHWIVNNDELMNSDHIDTNPFI